MPASVGGHLLARSRALAGPYWEVARGHVGVLAAWSAVSALGTLASPALLGHPLLLVLLSPRLAFLALAAHRLDLALFLLVGLVRLSVTDPVSYSLGRRVGDRFLRDVDDRAPARAARWFRWLADRSSGPILVAVLLRPNARHLGLAGARTLPPVLVFAASAVGTLGYLLVVAAGAGALRW